MSINVFNFFGGGGGSGGGALGNELLEGRNQLHVSQMGLHGGDAVFIEWLADKNAYDSNGDQLEIGGTLASWKSLCGRYTLNPISGSNITLEEDSDKFRYQDATDGASAWKGDTNLAALFSNESSKWTFIKVYEVPSVDNSVVLINLRNTSGNGRARLRVNSSYYLIADITNNALNIESIGGIYSTHYIHSANTKTVSFWANNGTKHVFATATDEGQIRYYDTNISDNGARTHNEIYIGCENNYGTIQGFSKLKLYQVIAVNKYMFRAEPVIRSLAKYYDMRIPRPKPFSYRTDTDAWTFAGTPAKAFSLRNTGFDFTKSGTLTNHGDDITISDKFAKSSSGGFLEMATPPAFLSSNVASDWTLLFRLRTTASFPTWYALTGIDDNSSNRMWKLELAGSPSNGRIYFEHWHSSGSLAITHPDALATEKFYFVWFYKSATTQKIGIAINDGAWHESAVTAALASPTSVTLQPWRVFKHHASSTVFLGGHQFCRAFQGLPLSQAERSFILSEDYYNSGHPPDNFPK